MSESPFPTARRARTHRLADLAPGMAGCAVVLAALLACASAPEAEQPATPPVAAGPYGTEGGGEPSPEPGTVPPTAAAPDEAGGARADDAGEAAGADVSGPSPAPASPAPSAASAMATEAPDVALARFTTAVEDREPIDAVSFLPNDRREVLFFTDLRHLGGETVVHRWEYAGQVMAEVPFEVGGDRWRIWSSKTLRPQWTGDWTASVVGPGTGSANRATSACEMNR